VVRPGLQKHFSKPSLCLYGAAARRPPLWPIQIGRAAKWPPSQQKEEQMRLTRFTRQGAAAIVSIALGSVLALGMAQDARAYGASNGPKTLEGTWWVQVTLLNDCTARAPIATFPALLTFANGGTMTGTTTNATFAVGQRSPDHGIWFRNSEKRTYTASSVALLLFTTAPNFPATPGFQAGSQRLDQTITVVDRDHFASEAVTRFFDVGGVKYREGCATAVGERFE
jgi:hypothetical protein